MASRSSERVEHGHGSPQELPAGFEMTDDGALKVFIPASSVDVWGFRPSGLEILDLGSPFGSRMDISSSVITSHDGADEKPPQFTQMTRGVHTILTGIQRALIRLGDANPPKGGSPKPKYFVAEEPQIDCVQIDTGTQIQIKSNFVDDINTQEEWAEVDKDRVRQARNRAARLAEKIAAKFR